jgi:hypothetical protein
MSILRKATALLVAATLLLLFLPVPVFAADKLHSLESKQKADGVWQHTLAGTDITFATSVKIGASSSTPVTVVIPQGWSLTRDGKIVTGAVASGGKRTFTFRSSGSYSMRITGPANGSTTPYAVFSFTIWAPGETVPATPSGGVESLPFRAVALEGGAGYYTNATPGESIGEAVIVFMFGGIQAVYTLDDEPEQSYVNGAEITKNGDYTMTFFVEEIAGQREIKGTLSFTKVPGLVAPPAENQTYTSPVNPEVEINPNLQGDTTPVTGAWSADSARSGNTTLPNNAVSISPIIQSGTDSVGGDNSAVIPLGGDGEDYATFPTSAATNSLAESLPGGNATAGWQSASGYYYDPVDDHLVLSFEPVGSYDSTFGTYEYGFAGRYFYTNVENGSIIAGPAYFDFPKNLTYTCEKDGEKWNFPNRTDVSDLGSYLLTISFVGADKVEYEFLFRFRIQEPVAGAAGATPGVTGDDSLSNFWLDGLTSSTGEGTDPSSGLDWIGGASGETSQTEAGIESDLPLDLSGLSEEDLLTMTEAELTGGDDELTQAELEEIGAQMAAPDPDSATATTTFTGNGVYTGLEEMYDTAMGMFSQTTAAGMTFYSSIPNGAVVSQAVTLNFPTDPGEITVLCDDQEIPYNPGETFTAHGAYSLSFGDNEIVNLLVGGGVAARFNFRIIDRPVNDCDVYNPPYGYELSSATLGEEELDISAGYVTLTADGTYQMISKRSAGEAPDLFVTVVRDTDPPVFSLTGVVNGLSTEPTVTVAYEESDLSHVILYRNGKEVSFNGFEISDPGSYQLDVLDKAQNVASAVFNLTYRLNTAAIVSVLLVLLLIGGGAFFFVRVRRRISVR